MAVRRLDDMEGRLFSQKMEAWKREKKGMAEGYGQKVNGTLRGSRGESSIAWKRKIASF